MVNISGINQELVRAFNINLQFNNIAVTNLTVENLDGKDHIVISFDKNMDPKQCMKYLNHMKGRIIERSYKNEKAAGVSYDLQSFPFSFNKGELKTGSKGNRFLVKIDEEVIFNLKCYLAQALARDMQEKMGKKFGIEYSAERIYDTSFDKDSYLYCMLFRNQELQVYFINSFIKDIQGYENAPKKTSDYLEIDDDYVYIKKGIFDDIEFIKDIEAHNASLICRDFEVPISEDEVVDKLKYTMISFINKVADIPVYAIIRTSHEGSSENSILVPIVSQARGFDRLLDADDVYKINSSFNMEILSDIGESISTKIPSSGRSCSSDSTVYGVDFADLDISCCVLSKIIESSVINKNHELAIDPELSLRLQKPSGEVSQPQVSQQECPRQRPVKCN